MKAVHIRLAPLLIAILMFAIGAPGQLSPKEEARFQFTKWQTRVDDLTKEVFSESSAVPDAERSLYLALLAKIWWEVDQNEARTYLKRSADKMLSGLGTDDPIELIKGIKLAQKTIDVIIKVDENFAYELIEQIETKLENGDGLNRKENLELASLYVSLGLRVVKNKPQQAMAFGFDSISYGLTASLPTLISELHAKDPAKAELLYRRAVAKLVGNYSNSALLFENNLFRVLFDVFGQHGFSEPMKRDFLSTFADRLAYAALVEPERPIRCKIAFYARAVPQYVDEHLPTQSLPFRQNIQTCAPYLPSQLQEMTRGQARADQPKTVDGFVRAAKETSDLEMKVRFWREALALLEIEKKYGEAISLLDSTDGDDFKKGSPIGWDIWRVTSAYQVAIKSLEDKDLPSAYRVIEKTPRRLRPSVRMKVAKKLTPLARENPFYLENLDEMQKELGSLEQVAKEVVNSFTTLAELYLKVRPTESELMFRNAVKYINKADSDNPNFTSEKDWAPMFDYVPMSCELLEADEYSITSSLSAVSSRRSRVRLKLGLLESSLKKYVAVKKTLDELTKPKKK